MPTTITASQVVSDFGAFYIDAGQNESNIHTTLRENFDTQDAFTVVESEDTVLRETNAEFGEIVQAFQTAWTPKGSVDITPISIPLFNLKVDAEFYPDALKNQWLSFMTSNNLDRTTWPFVRWFIEKYVIGQIMADMEKTGYPAVYAAPTVGTASSAASSYNGIKKLINDAITASLITPIVTGAPNTTQTTWCTQVETFLKGIPELYWNNAFQLNTSRALALRYREGRTLKYNTNYAQISDRDVVQNFESVKVKGYGSMSNVNKIWGTLKNNAIMAFKGGSNKSIMEVEKIDRKVKVYTDFWIGLGFINPKLVWTNDQDLPV